MSRPLYRHADLQRLISPQSIAIVGASAREGSFGHRLLRNLAGYAGRLHLVNSRYDQIEGRSCHPSLSALPEVPDCAVIAAPREQVEPLVEECGRLGIGGVIVFASGFAETGKPERAQDQARIVAAAQRAGVRLVGPNCLGVINYSLGAIVSFAAAAAQDRPRRQAIGLVSQSGALGFALGQAIEHGVSFSHVLTAGNSADVDVADYVAYLAEDDACTAIACLFEGMADPSRLLEAAALAQARGKPVIVFKIATGEQGAAAAMSHTGSLAGSDRVYRAAFERAGIVLVDDYEALVETAAFFAKAPRPAASGVAVASTSGGAAILAADEAELCGVALPQPAAHTRAVLEESIPEFGSPRNPCDITAQVLSDPASFRRVAEALIADEAYGTLVVPFVYAYDTATPRIGVLDELARTHGKIACIVWLTQWMEGPGTRVAEQAEHVALFRSMRACFTALKKWQWWAQRSAAPISTLGPAAPSASAQELEAVGASLDAEPADVLTEGQAKGVLAAYGIPMVTDRLVDSADAAVVAAAQTGYPVVMKVESVAIPHKTEAGVVRLGLGDEAAVRAAYADVMANARKIAQADEIRGVLVQPMIGAGVEVLVGARVDPLFGPTVVVGLGGVMVELMRDSAIALAPVGHDEALAMLKSLKGAPLLTGFRGSDPVDLDRLADIVCRVSQFASDHRGRITELDLNPLICTRERIVGVDALIGLRSKAERG
jgi:acyl-CoA synthetase (NDP forming)